MTPEKAFVSAMGRLDCVGGKRCIIAFSGGSDSTALLRLCCSTVAITENIYLAVRVRHDIRAPEIEENEISFCRELCRTAGLDFLSVGGGEQISLADIAQRRRSGPEQAAREFRHSLLDSVRRDRNFDCILFAHTADDNRETLLMRVFRGSGPEGLKGIPRSRDAIRRPLLEMEREDLQNYLKSENHRWCEDSTNKENIYLRNSVRNRLIPLLSDIFPGWEHAAEILLERSGEAESALRESLRRQLPEKMDADRSIWNLRDWMDAADYLKALALYGAIDRLSDDSDGAAGPVRWRQVTLLRDAADRGRQQSFRKLRIRRVENEMILEKIGEEWEGREVLRLDSGQMPLRLHHGDLELQISETGPGQPVRISGETGVLLLEWKAKERRTRLSLKTPDGQILASADSDGALITVNSSKGSGTDVDKKIVYIQTRTD